MAGDKVPHRVGTEFIGAQRRHCGNKSVNHHRTAGCRSTDECTAHRCKIKTAHLGQHIHNIVFVRSIYRNGSFDHFLFLAETFICDAAATAGNSIDICIQKNSKNSGRSRGIANAHFPNADHIRIGILSKFHTGHNCLHRLFPGHSWTVNNILRTIGNLLIQHLGFFDVGIDAHIAHSDIATKVLAQSGCSCLMAG